MLRWRLAGPFNYSGSIINVSALANTSFASGGGTKDRHGSFFTFKGQTYFTCNDESHGGGGGFRNTIISYVHYRANGTIATIRIDETGVGMYNVSGGAERIEAEDYYEIVGGRKAQLPSGPDDFAVVGLQNGSALTYPRLHGGSGRALTLLLANGGAVSGTVVVSANGKQVASCAVQPTGGWAEYKAVACGRLPSTGDGPLDLELGFRAAQAGELARLDALQLRAQ